MNRRKLLRTTLALAAGTLAGLATATPARPLIEVWKTPTCGCCKAWIRHLQAQGFEVKAHDVSNAVKNDYRRHVGLEDRFGSCHTALVKGYVIEGHVPAREIHRLLKDKPRALGLAVLGMPVGSPGMDGPAIRWSQRSLRRAAGAARRHGHRLPDLSVTPLPPIGRNTP